MARANGILMFLKGPRHQGQPMKSLMQSMLIPLGCLEAKDLVIQPEIRLCKSEVDLRKGSDDGHYVENR